MYVSTVKWKSPHRYGKSHAIWNRPAAVTFPPVPQPKLVLDLVTQEGGKGELTWMVVKSRDSLPAKDGHLSQK